jgi:flagellar biosynthesis/type III secretory pathway protein FliH
MTKGLACCELRFLANAPPHVVFAAESRVMREGWQATQAFKVALAQEKARLAKIRREQRQQLGQTALELAREILAA